MGRGLSDVQRYVLRRAGKQRVSADSLAAHTDAIVKAEKVDDEDEESES
jgi:hypothetical protein